MDSEGEECCLDISGHVTHDVEGGVDLRTLVETIYKKTVLGPARWRSG